jgi:hypothetical protein
MDHVRRRGACRAEENIRGIRVIRGKNLLSNNLDIKVMI